MQQVATRHHIAHQADYDIHQLVVDAFWGGSIGKGYRKRIKSSVPVAVI